MRHLTIRQEPEVMNRWAVRLNDWDTLRYFATRSEAIDYAMDYMKREFIKGGLQAIDKEVKSEA